MVAIRWGLVKVSADWHQSVLQVLGVHFHKGNWRPKWALHQQSQRNSRQTLHDCTARLQPTPHFMEVWRISSALCVQETEGYVAPIKGCEAFLRRGIHKQEAAVTGPGLNEKHPGFTCETGSEWLLQRTRPWQAAGSETDEISLSTG